MGDTGSLALGGAVAMMALFSRAALLLPIMADAMSPLRSQ